MKSHVMKLPWEQPISISTERTIIEFMPGLNRNSRILDFGAGFGRYLSMFGKYVDQNNLFGLEADSESIARAVSLGFRVFKSDSRKPWLPFPSGFFNFVFSSNVIEHIPRSSYLRYLAEIKRVLKPEGRFLVGTPNYPFKRIYDIPKAFSTKLYKYYFFDDPTHVNKLSYLQLVFDLKRFFNIVDVRPTYVFFENRIPLIKRYRRTFVIFSDKLFGYADKN